MRYFSLLCAMLTVACGSDPGYQQTYPYPLTPGGSTSQTDGGNTTVNQTDGGNTTVTPPAARKAGLVQLSQTVITFTGGSSVSSSLLAQFSSGDASASGPCTTKKVGNCTLSTDCKYNTSTDGGTPPPQYVSAGVISVEGARMPLVIEPGSDSKYSVLSKTEKVANEGDVLTFTAQGDSEGVPAFEAEVKSPTLVTLNRWNGQAWPSTTQGLKVARNQALKVEWTGNAEGQINISLSGGLTNNTYTALANCRFEASSKSATLPTEVLNAMPKGQGSVGISQLSETTVAAGSHDVVNRFITYPKTSSSQFPALTVTFEN